MLCYGPPIKSRLVGKTFVRSFLGCALAATAVLAVAGMPAQAQISFSNSYTFLKAVKDRDGDKVTNLLSSPSTFVINTRENGTGNGALHIVTRDRDLTWLNFLLTKGAKVDLENGEGDTHSSSPRRSAGWKAPTCCCAAARASTSPTAAVRRR